MECNGKYCTYKQFSEKWHEAEVGAVVENFRFFGGRGASSGLSDKGKKYGSEYKTLYQTGNIKFVSYNNGSATAPMETMTDGRVYAVVNTKNEIKSISYYDKNKKRYKQIDTGHLAQCEREKRLICIHIKGYIHDRKGNV